MLKFLNAAVKDVADYISPQQAQEEPQTLTGKFVKKAKQLNAIAKGTFEKKTKVATLEPQELVPDQDRLEFALGERLALDIAYRPITLQQRVIPLLEEDNNIRDYRIVALDSGHGGIVANILIPASHNHTGRVYINFRGTDPHNPASFHLDLEHCAGEESFHRHLPQMMQQINEAIAQASGTERREVELIISGHSLGSALSQYCLNAVMMISALHLQSALKAEQVDFDTQALISDVQANFNQYLSKQYDLPTPKMELEEYQNFSKVQTFKINSWSTLGVSNRLEFNTNVLADILKANGKNVAGRFLNNKLDIVTKLGQGNSLSASNADVVYMEVEDQNLDLDKSAVAGVITGLASAALLGGIPGLIIGGATGIYTGLRPLTSAHCDCNFGKYGELLTAKQYTVFRNETSLGQRKIAEVSEDKLSVFQTPILYKAKTLLKHVGDTGSKIKKGASAGIVEVIKAIDSTSASSVLTETKTRIKK